MKFYNPFSKPKVPREHKIALGQNNALGAFMRTGTKGAITPSGALSLYEQSTAVSIPINMVTDSFKTIEPILLLGGVFTPKHPLLDLLQNPSPYFTRTQFFEVIAKDFLITGNTYIAGLGDHNRPPLELQPLSPRNVQINSGKSGLPASYVVGGGSMTGDYERVDTKTGVAFVKIAADIKQIRMYSTKSNSLLEGQSRLLSASREANQHILGSHHNMSLLEKGGHLSLVFHFHSDMDDQTFEDAKSRIDSQFGGAQSAGQHVVSAGGSDTMEIKEFGINAKDMDFANLQSMAKQAVALQYGVPLPLITMEASTFNNYQEAKLALYDDATIPLILDLFGGLSDWLLPRFGLDPATDMLSYDPDKISALQSRRNKEMKVRREIDVESDNEIRAQMQLLPYPEGGLHLKPANLVPAGTEPLPAPAPDDL